MQKLVNDQNISKRWSFLDVTTPDLNHRDCLAGDSLQQNIFGWLSPPDPWKNHHIACKSRQRGSAAWFIQGSTFLEWKASETQSPHLWVHGKRPLMPSSDVLVEPDYILFSFSQRVPEKVFFGVSNF